MFIQFLIFGIILGVIEDLLAIMWSTGESFSWLMLVIIVVVAIPFAAIGEFVVDQTSWFSKRGKGLKKWGIVFEFFIFGLVMGVAEDLLAVVLATNHPITWSVVGICALVTLPFAFMGEVVVDRLIPYFSRHRA